MDIPYTVSARPDTGLYNGKLGVWLFLASEVMLFGAIFTAYLFVRIGADDGSWPNHIQNVWLGLTNTILLLTSSITMVWAWVALKERNLGKYRLALGLTIICGVVFLGIKGIEYHSKYEHFGFMIKDDKFAQYQPALDKEHAYYSAIPEQHVVEVRGHWHGMTFTDGKPATYLFLPDKAPGFALSLVGAKPDGPAMNTAASEEDEPIALQTADIERFGRLLPKYGTYYAVYFLVTGLHAMHIIGGVVVMFYFLTIGSRMYRRNPEQLTNRIEVTGIFWHFVDLVWITAFPLLYLT
jgi:cytochrome c oxidase subunit III